MNIDTVKMRILETLQDIKGEQIVSIDLSGEEIGYEFMILVNGMSNIHNIAMANRILRALKCMGASADSVEGLRPGHWIAISSCGILLHIFQKPVRQYYNLEELWKHCCTTPQ